MGLYEYRKKHPKCRYCQYADLIPFTFWYTCNAKCTVFAFGARKCEMYEPLREEC